MAGSKTTPKPAKPRSKLGAALAGKIQQATPLGRSAKQAGAAMQDANYRATKGAKAPRKK